MSVRDADRDGVNEELHLGGQTIGFINRSGHIFVASMGALPTRCRGKEDENG